MALAPIAGCHKGTGTHAVPKLLLDPASLGATGSPTFSQATVTITTFLYALDDATVAPNWFGVAVPPGVADYTRPIIYFHPTANQGPYSDADYPSKGISDDHRGWKELFEYVDRLGHQLAGAVQRGASNPDQVLILPFMPSFLNGVFAGAGVLGKNWEAIVTDILIDVRAAMTGVVAPLSVTDVVVASFSNGALYADSFRKAAVDLSSRLSACWDFDCYPPVTSTKPVLRYDASATPGFNHLPLPRWSGLPNPMPVEEPALPKRNDLHHLFRDFMFLDAVMRR